jgi:eukaryotic-like serine/threonine-protein kinase
MPIASGTRLGVYEVVAQIGAGGMGEVYRAHDTRLNRNVALKVLPEAFSRDMERMARFEREAKVLASLNHTNIAAIYGFEESGPIRALVMELVEGPTLADRILSGAIPLEEALPIAKQVADAVEYAHDKNVIHRDLKPANIKVTADGTVKVLDFGLAKAMSDDVAEINMANSPTLSMAATQAGIILGTAADMSPEQAKGKPVDRRADVWAFGVILYEMLTGKQLFEGETIADTLAHVITKDPSLDTLPATTPPAIRTLLRRCLDRNLKRRLVHIGEARILLEDVISGVAPVAPDSIPSANVPSEANRWIPWAACALAVALLAIVSFVHFREVAPLLPSLRFDIPPPEKTALAMFKLSPNGRYAALVAAQGGSNQLWVRSLDSAEARLLPGTDDAAYPFWSPDSSYIGFFARGKLKKISLNGGPAQSICDAPGGRGASWNRDGIIIFAPKISSGLFRVPGTGGTPEAVTKVTTPGVSDGQRFPEFISGGNQFTFFYQTEQPESFGIYVGSLDGKPPVRISPDASNAIYAASSANGRSGYLLFVRENTLLAQPFDPAGLRLTGEAIPIAESVSFSTTAGNGAFSAAENGLLAYRTGAASGVREWVWMDRQGRRLSAVTKPAVITSGAMSPDEKTLAYEIFEPNGSSDLWLQDLSRGAASRFTFEPRISSFPVWSPDGSQIAFSLRPTAGVSFVIARKPVSGNGKQEVLLPVRVNGYPWDWTPDGKFIVYSDTGETTNYDLWLLPLAGDHKPISLLQTKFNETRAQFSPDGQWVAYVSDESGKLEVYVQPMPATGGKWQVSTSGGDQPPWRKDGKELYYLAADGKLTAVPVKTIASSSSNFEIGPPQPLFPVPDIVGSGGITSRYSYQPSADGKRFLVDVPAGGEGVAQPPITMTLNWQATLKK